MASEVLYIGIDPQPDNISVCVTLDDMVIHWYMYKLLKKSTFNRSTDWLQYITDRIAYIVGDVNTNITSSCTTENTTRYLVVFIEQQYGRVNSMIESSLYTMFSIYDFNAIQHKSISTIAPSSWRKIVGLYNMGSNRLNKQVANKFFSVIYEREMGRPYISNDARVHDMFDAFMICNASRISNSMTEKSKNEALKQLWQTTDMDLVG